MIKKIKLGKTKINVTELALGCGFRGLNSVRSAVNMLEYAIDQGINFIDCANIYQLRNGEYAEKALAYVLRKNRNGIVITSKFGAPALLDDGRSVFGASPEMIFACIDNSLNRLKTDYIDIFLMHGPDRNTPMGDIVYAFNRLIKSGKILGYGLCNCPAEYILNICKVAKENNLIGPTVVQSGYNLINRSVETAIFPLLHSLDISFMAYSPLATGLLSGKINIGKEIPKKSTWGYDKDYSEYLNKILKGRIKEIIDYLEKLSGMKGLPVPAIAIAWILKNENVDICISGADLPCELNENLLFSNVEFTVQEKDYLDKLSEGLSQNLTKKYGALALRNSS